MRVAVDVTPLLGAPTGVYQTVSGLLGALPSAAPDVTLVPYVLSARAVARPSDREALVPGGARALPFPASLAIRSWGRWSHPKGDRWLHDADVVHGTNYVVPPMTQRPMVITVNDCWALHHPELCTREVAAVPAAVRRLIDMGAWVHVSTEFVAQEVRDLYGADRVSVVPFGVPPTGAPGPLPGAIGGRPFLLAMGSLDARKAIDSLVTAFGRLTDDHPDLVLVIAGPDGGHRSTVEAARAALPAATARRVLLLGPVDDPTRSALLRGAAALAYPSVYEGFGLPIIEAMAEGVPVVATATGGIPEVAGDAAELVAPGDLDALADALDRVFTDDDHRAELVAAGQARAATFTWTRTALGLADLWRRAVR